MPCLEETTQQETHTQSGFNAKLKNAHPRDTYAQQPQERTYKAQQVWQLSQGGTRPSYNRFRLVVQMRFSPYIVSLLLFQELLTLVSLGLVAVTLWLLSLVTSRHTPLPVVLTELFTYLCHAKATRLRVTRSGNHLFCFSHGPPWHGWRFPILPRIQLIHQLFYSYHRPRWQGGRLPILACAQICHWLIHFRGRGSTRSKLWNMLWYKFFFF